MRPAVSFGLMANSSEAVTISNSDIVAAALNSHFFILFNSVLGAMIVFMLPSRSIVENSL